MSTTHHSDGRPQWGDCSHFHVFVVRRITRGLSAGTNGQWPAWTWKGTTPTVATLLPMNYGYTALEIRHGKLVLTWLLPVTTSSGGGPGPIAGCGADCRCSLRQRRRSPGGYPRLRKPHRPCYNFAVPFRILPDSGRYSTRATAERCQSGRMGATGNRVGVNASRGFESRPLRH